MRPSSLLFALALSLAPLAAAAQDTVCVPGNPLYDRGDYRCFACSRSAVPRGSRRLR